MHYLVNTRVITLKLLITQTIQAAISDTIYLNQKYLKMNGTH